MANYSFWALGASHITVSGGQQLSGFTQGDGTHLIGETITLNSYAFEEILVRDGGSDDDFDDNDGNQRLRGGQSFDGSSYSNNTGIEAEYRIVLRDASTGLEYEALAVNINNSSPAYGTVEGLAFVDVIPPAGVALEVLSAFEGPGSSGQPAIVNLDIAVPACFTPGTRLRTDSGWRPVETLRAGDRVWTRDHGMQDVLWVGQTVIGAAALARRPELRPIRIAAHAFGPGRPERALMVSPQHRILLDGPWAELCFGEAEVLAAAAHLVDGDTVTLADSAGAVVYVHIQCAAHEILTAEGLLSESFSPGPQTLGAFPPGARAMLLDVLPTAPDDSGPALAAARPMIRRHEAALWRKAG